MNLQKMAATIRMARAHARLCQRDVALQAGLSHWRLQQFEAARIQPTQSELDALGSALPLFNSLFAGEFESAMFEAAADHANRG